MQAYSPLTRATKMDDPELNEIAKDANATPAQVLVAWSLAKNFIPLPKSVTATHQQQNLEGANVKLSAEHVARLDALDEHLITTWDPITLHSV